MFSAEERNRLFVDMMKSLDSSDLVEGVIQLGSGVNGYKDELSDIDLMVAASRIEDAEPTKHAVCQILSSYNPICIKEKQLRKEIYLIIAIMRRQKLHQFKAYETLNPSFRFEYLSTYPAEITADSLSDSAEKLKHLFAETV